jgi:hypothetical protein
MWDSRLGCPADSKCGDGRLARPAEHSEAHPLQLCPPKKRTPANLPCFDFPENRAYDSAERVGGL